MLWRTGMNWCHAVSLKRPTSRQRRRRASMAVPKGNRLPLGAVGGLWTTTQFDLGAHAIGIGREPCSA
jgi:hypothetical protein